MAYYNYKRVFYRDDFKAEEKAYEAEGTEYEGGADYDGDGWLIVARLLDKKDAEIARLRASPARAAPEAPREPTPSATTLDRYDEVMRLLEAYGDARAAVATRPIGDVESAVRLTDAENASRAAVLNALVRSAAPEAEDEALRRQIDEEKARVLKEWDAEDKKRATDEGSEGR